MFHARLANSSCKYLALTRDLMAPVTLLTLTTFLLHSAPSVSDSSKTCQKYLNSKTCSKRITSTRTSHSNHITTLLLPTLTFSPLLLHTSTNRHTINLSSSFDSPHRKKSSEYKRPGNLLSLSSSRNLTPLLPIPIVITASIYTLKS